jgi:CMP/dCMP kinase
VSPLAAAGDAVVLDTDHLTVDDVLDELRRLVAERGMVR